MEDEEARVQCYIKLQGIVREISDQLRQINARSTTELAEIKQMVATRVTGQLRPACYAPSVARSFNTSAQMRRYEEDEDDMSDANVDRRWGDRSVPCGSGFSSDVSDPFAPARSLSHVLKPIDQLSKNPFLAASLGISSGAQREWDTKEDAEAVHLKRDMQGLGKHFDVELVDKDAQQEILFQYSHKNVNRTVVNLYIPFGQRSVWPRGLSLENMGKIGQEEFYTEIFSGKQFIQQGISNGLTDVDSVFYFTRKSGLEAFDVRFDEHAPKVALPEGIMVSMNSFNTWFHSSALWELMLPVLVSAMASDVLRGYWAQRLLWEIGGFVVVYSSTMHRNDRVESYHFLKEKDLHVNVGKEHVKVSVEENTLTIKREGEKEWVYGVKVRMKWKGMFVYTKLFAMRPLEVLRILKLMHGDFWTEFEGGVIKVWPWEASEKSLSLSSGEKHMATLLIERSSVDLKSQVTVNGACSIFSSDMTRLLSDNVRGKVWAATPSSFPLWNSRTKGLVKVFNIEGQVENRIEMPGNSKQVMEDEMKAKFVSSSQKEKSHGSFLQWSHNAIMGVADAVRGVATRGAGAIVKETKKKTGALPPTADEMIWAGCSNGLMVQWDEHGNQLKISIIISVLFSAAVYFGTGKYVRCISGLSTILDLEGNDIAGWTSHTGTVIIMAVEDGQIYSLATHHQSNKDFKEYHEVTIRMMPPINEDHVRTVLERFNKFSVGVPKGRRIVQRRNRAISQKLVQWSNASMEEATSEYCYDVQRRFPDVALGKLQWSNATKDEAIWEYNYYFQKRFAVQVPEVLCE